MMWLLPKQRPLLFHYHVINASQSPSLLSTNTKPLLSCQSGHQIPLDKEHQLDLPAGVSWSFKWMLINSASEIAKYECRRDDISTDDRCQWCTSIKWSGNQSARLYAWSMLFTAVKKKQGSTKGSQTFAQDDGSETSIVAVMCIYTSACR